MRQPRAVRNALMIAACAAAPAFAEPVPGTGGDPLRELMVDPAFAYTDLPSGLAVRGGNPEDTLLLFDGFELPATFHAGGVRSLVPPGAADVQLLASGFGVEYGRGSSVVTLAPRAAQQSLFGELTVLDAHVHSVTDRVGSSIRFGHDALASEWRPSDPGAFADGIAFFDVPLTKRLTLATSAIGSFGADHETYRLVSGLRYESRDWLASLAASPLSHERGDVTRFAIDTRGEVIRRAARAAGLAKLEWRLGQETSSTHYDQPIGAGWRTDIGLWSSIGANLSSRIRATTGMRVDYFDGDVATQPRGSLALGLTRHLEVTLAAGAYRRPPRQDGEIAVATLNPERATQVVAGAAYDSNHGYRITGTAYYIDRRRLVARDDFGVLGNSGFGTSAGVELAGSVREGPWLARIATSLASSTRTDYLRGRARPAPLSQPFRLELLGAWTHRRVTVSARLQLASGLPYTPYDGAIYDSDDDVWVPRYVEPLSARTPFHHQVDVRLDYRLATGAVKLAAFVDLHNAYGNRDAIAYTYSYDYAQRAAITALPLFPFAGLRAYL